MIDQQGCHQQWINDLTESEQYEIVKKYTRAYSQIIKPSLRITKWVIEQDVDSLPDKVDLCEKAQQFLMVKQPDFFRIIENPTKEIINMALEISPYNISYVKDPSENQIMAAISKDPKIIHRFSGERRKLIEGHIETYAKIIS